MSAEPRWDDFVFRSPETKDGKYLWEIASASGTLDVNSTYHYLIMCRHFSHTSIIAEDKNQIVGFVTGYVPPKQTDTLFVWQVAVDKEYRGLGIGSKLLLCLYDKVKADKIRNINTTITASNDASIKLFTTVARKLVAPVTFKETFFSAVDFGKNAHAPEQLFHIGPIEEQLNKQE